jgi:hypothetical protein
VNIALLVISTVLGAVAGWVVGWLVLRQGHLRLSAAAWAIVGALAASIALSWFPLVIAGPDGVRPDPLATAAASLAGALLLAFIMSVRADSVEDRRRRLAGTLRGFPSADTASLPAAVPAVPERALPAVPRGVVT